MVGIGDEKPLFFFHILFGCGYGVHCVQNWLVQTVFSTDLSIGVVTAAAGMAHAVTLHFGGEVSPCLDPQGGSLPAHIPVVTRAFRQSREAGHSIGNQRQVTFEPCRANGLGAGRHLPHLVQPRSHTTCNDRQLSVGGLQKLTSLSVENPELTNLLPFKAWSRSEYWTIQRSWFARVNALCNLRARSRERSQSTSGPIFE